MSKVVEFYYDFGSPNVYLAWRALERVDGLTLNLKPVLIGGLFKGSNNQPPWQAFAGVRVFAVGDDDEFVLEREFVERNPGVGERRGRDAASIERDGVDASGDQVDEGRRALGGGEAHGGGRPEHLRAGGQIQLDLIRLRVEDAATLLRFDAGEVFSRHFRMLPSV